MDRNPDFGRFFAVGLRQQPRIARFNYNDRDGVMLGIILEQGTNQRHHEGGELREYLEANQETLLEDNQIPREDLDAMRRNVGMQEFTPYIQIQRASRFDNPFRIVTVTVQGGRKYVFFTPDHYRSFLLINL